MNGENLKIAIKKAGYTQVSLAETLGVDVNTVWRWTKGTSPTDDRKREIAAILGVSVAYLMGETDDPTPADKTAQKEQPVIKSNVHFETEEPISIDQIIIPVLSPEQTACCGNGIPLSEITSGRRKRQLFRIRILPCKITVKPVFRLNKHW